MHGKENGDEGEFGFIIVPSMSITMSVSAAAVLIRKQ
jgi:hypothetical protein